MGADDVDAEPARLVEEREPVVSIEAPAAVGRVDLPGGDADLLGELGHALDLRLALIGQHQAVDHQPLRTGPGELADQIHGRLLLRDLQRVLAGIRRHRRQDGDVGLAVDEHLAQVVRGVVAIDVVGLAAGPLRQRLEVELPAGVVLPPRPRRVHVVGLDVEDELIAAELGAGLAGVPGRRRVDRVAAVGRAAVVATATELLGYARSRQRMRPVGSPQLTSSGSFHATLAPKHGWTIRAGPWPWHE